MLGYEDFEEKTIARKEIFKGNIIDVYLDDVALPQGGTSQRELVFHPGGVGVLAITPDNKIVLVKQFRKPLEKVIEPKLEKITEEDKNPFFHFQNFSVSAERVS